MRQGFSTFKTVLKLLKSIQGAPHIQWTPFMRAQCGLSDHSEKRCCSTQHPPGDGILPVALHHKRRAVGSHAPQRRDAVESETKTAAEMADATHQQQPETGRGVGAHRQHAPMRCECLKQSPHANASLHTHTIGIELDGREMGGKIEHQCSISCTETTVAATSHHQGQTVTASTHHRLHHILLMTRLENARWVGRRSVTVEQRRQGLLIAALSWIQSHDGDSERKRGLKCAADGFGIS